MSAKLKVLVISNLPWQDSNSFGSTFSNIFGDPARFEIANIYTQPGYPNTKTCSHFFQITDFQILDSIRSGKNHVGEEVGNRPPTIITDAKKPKIETKLRALNYNLVHWARYCLWGLGLWRNKNLDDFVTKFDPDIIFLPLYRFPFIHNIGLHCAKIAPSASFVTFALDDYYSFKFFSYYPLSWVDRLITRSYFSKSVRKSKLLFTITETQKNEYTEVFGNKCRILFKGGDFSDFSHRKTTLNRPLKFVYTGNIGSGRWKTLALIGDAIAKTEGSAELIVYSATTLAAGDMKRLLRSGAVKFMGSIPSAQVKDVQRDADILVHVESFELSERYSARLSFSTKIVDYFEAGRCILAVGWEQTGAIDYLSRHDGAVVVTDRRKIEAQIADLVKKPEIITEYADKGYDLGKRFHQIAQIRTDLYETLIRLQSDGTAKRNIR